MSDPDNSPPAPASTTAALCALAIAVVFWAAVPIFIKYFSNSLDAWTVNAVRYSVAALFWMPFVCFLRNRTPPHKSVWKDALFPSFVNLVGQAGWALTPYYNDAGVNSFLIRSSFLFTILTGFILLREERVIVRRIEFQIGSLVCVAGIVIMFLEGLEGFGCTPDGVALLLFTALFWGLYGVSVKRNMKEYPARLSFGVISIYTAVGLILLMLLFGNPGKLVDVTASLWCLMVVSALTGIAFAHVLMYRAMMSLGSLVTSGALQITPFITILGSALILGEMLTARQWLAGTMLVAGGFLLVLARRKKPGCKTRKD